MGETSKGVTGNKLSATQWRSIVSRYKRSGLRQAEFCRRAGLKLSSFQYWLYDVANAGNSKGGGDLFVELSGRDGFEIERNGYCVKVPSNFRPAALRALLEVVGS